MDKTAAKLNISVVNMNNLAEIILKRLRPIARKNDIEVNLVSAREVLAEVDEVKMSLILTNLVENAIKYNKEHGEVTVTLDADHQFLRWRWRTPGSGSRRMPYCRSTSGFTGWISPTRERSGVPAWDLRLQRAQ